MKDKYIHDCFDKVVPTEIQDRKIINAILAKNKGGKIMTNTKRRFTGKAVAAILAAVLVLGALTVAAVTLLRPVAEDQRDVARFNGEIVVSGIIIDAPSPYLARDDDELFTNELHNIHGYTMVPLNPIAEALGYEIVWNEVFEGYTIDGRVNIWLDVPQAQTADYELFELLVAPYERNGVIWVPLTLFRDALEFGPGRVYSFEGQVVIENRPGFEME